MTENQPVRPISIPTSAHSLTVGVLAACLVLLGPAWLYVMPDNLEIGAIGYGLSACILAPVAAIILLVVLRISKRWFSIDARLSRAVIASVFIVFIGLVLTLVHRSIRDTAFNAEILVGPLRYWRWWADGVAGVGLLASLAWLVEHRNSFHRAVCGYLALLMLVCVLIPASIAGYAHIVSKSSPEWTAWKQGGTSEQICGNILSRDRYDCYQKLASDTNVLNYCSQSWPNLSCAQPFALKGDYSFCNNSMLVKDNPTGWHPGEVELASDGSEKYQKEFSLNSDDLIPVYCVAGLLHQQWAVDCDWLPGQVAAECRAKEIGPACSYLQNKTQPACLKALAGEGLFTGAWFDRNFHILNDKAVNFYPNGTATELLGYLRIPTGSATVSQVYDSDRQVDDVIVKRIFRTPGQSGQAGTVAATFFGAASRTASMETVEKAVYATNFELRKSPVLSEQNVTIFGQQARMRTYSNGDTYAFRVTYRVVTFRYKDANYALLFDSSSRSVDWRDFIAHMSLEPIWQQ